MTFSPEEAELILREGWDDAEIVGGFQTELEGIRAMEDMVERFDVDHTQFKLLGKVEWRGYEEYAINTLWADANDELMLFREGYTVFGEFGLNFLDEIEPITIVEWLAIVESLKD